MGLLPLNHFDDPPQLSLQVACFEAYYVPKIEQNSGLITGAHTQTHSHTRCIADTGRMVADSLGNSLEGGGSALTK